MTDQAQEDDTVKVDVRKPFLAAVLFYDQINGMSDIEQAVAFTSAAISIFGNNDVKFYDLLKDMSPQVHLIIDKMMAEKEAEIKVNEG